MKLYVAVRDDLTLSQKAVQAGHALAEHIFGGCGDWYNDILVYVKIEDEKALKELVDKLDRKGYNYRAFREPDMNDELTAVASVEGKSYFSKLPLL